MKGDLQNFEYVGSSSVVSTHAVGKCQCKERESKEELISVGNFLYRITSLTGELEAIP